MKIFVWQGEKVLRNYRTGLVVVAAGSPEEAWSKLRRYNINAYYALHCDQRCVYDETDVKFIDQDDIVEAERRGFPIQPVAYSVEDLPVLVLPGSD